MSRKIEIQIIGDADSLTRATRQGTGSLGKLDGATDASTSKWSKFSGVAKAAAAGGLGALVVGLKGSVTAARDSEASQTRMETQLKALGVSYKAHAGEIDTVIQKTSKLAGLDDEDLQDAFTGIVRVTGDVNKSLKLTGLAADIARGKNIDLAAASKAVEKAAGGNAGALKKLVGGMKDGATASDVLAAAQGKFAGQAEAYGKTAGGAQDRFKVATENLQEAIGKGLLPVITKLANGVTGLVGWFEKHHNVAVVLMVAIGALGGVLLAMKVAALTSAAATAISSAATGGWAAVTGFATAVGGGFTAAFWALNAAMVANPIGLVVVAIALLVGGLVVAWRSSETFRGIITGAFGAVKNAAVFAFGLIKKAAEVGLLGPIGLVITHWRQARDVLSGVWGAVRGAATTAWNAVKSAIVTPVEAAVGLVSTAASGIGNRLSTAWSGIKSAASSAWDFVHDKILGPLRAARDAVAGIVGALGGRVGTAWGTVKGTVQSIGREILSALVSPFEQAYGAIKRVVDRIRSLVSSVAKLPGKALGALGIGGNAQGGTISGLAQGGVVRRVGELGPEDVLLPVGSQVTQASQSHGGGMGGVNFYGPVTIGSHRDAQVMGNQLAFRLRFG